MESGALLKMLDFNSHAHVERDLYYNVITAREQDFNSHAHVERDGLKINNGSGTFNFNSHAHVERDLTVRLSALG